MELSKEVTETFETRADLEREVVEAGQSMPSIHQLERWRGEGLLPPVRQVPKPYDGSVVQFPMGTAKQIIQIQKLLKIKNSFDFVGWELWWEGFSVDEKHWRPMLEHSAKSADQILKLIKRLQRREDTYADDIEKHPESLFDRKIELPKTGNMFSRIDRRIKEEQVGPLLRIFAEVGGGRFEHFDDVNDNSAYSEQNLVIAALDIHDGNSHNPARDLDSENNQHVVMGHRLNLSQGISAAFAAISLVLRANNFVDMAQLPAAELSAARDDVRRGCQIATDLYNATNWIYGPRAFGLRLINWIAERQTPVARSIYTLIFVLLRRGNRYLLPSSDIQSLALEASRLREQSLQIRNIAENDPILKALFTPKNIRRSLLNKNENELFLARIKDAKRGI